MPRSLQRQPDSRHNRIIYGTLHESSSKELTFIRSPGPPFLEIRRPAPGLLTYTRQSHRPTLSKCELPSSTVSPRSPVRQKVTFEQSESLSADQQREYSASNKQSKLASRNKYHGSSPQQNESIVLPTPEQHIFKQHSVRSKRRGPSKKGFAQRRTQLTPLTPERRAAISRAMHERRTPEQRRIIANKASRTRIIRHFMEYGLAAPEDTFNQQGVQHKQSSSQQLPVPRSKISGAQLQLLRDARDAREAILSHQTSPTPPEDASTNFTHPLSRRNLISSDLSPHGLRGKKPPSAINQRIHQNQWRLSRFKEHWRLARNQFGDVLDSRPAFEADPQSPRLYTRSPTGASSGRDSDVSSFVDKILGLRPADPPRNQGSRPPSSPGPSNSQSPYSSVNHMQSKGRTRSSLPVSSMGSYIESLRRIHPNPSLSPQFPSGQTTPTQQQSQRRIKTSMSDTQSKLIPERRQQQQQ